MIFKNTISLDLGTSSAIIYIKGKGIVLQEPSIVAIDEDGKIAAIGDEAKRRLGRGDDIREVKPLEDGMVSDFNMVRTIVEYFLNRVVDTGFFRPDVIICIPEKLTDVEERGVIQAAHDSGANNVDIVVRPLAAAAGAGIDIDSPYANMIVDMGGGTTEISVVASRNIVDSLSIKEGGDALNRDIKEYIKEKYNADISIKNAENIKRRIGSAIICPREDSLEVSVWDLDTDEQKKITVMNTEVQKAMEKSLASIVGAIRDVLDGLTDEEKADITNHGINLIGGGALLEGVDRLIAAELGIKTKIAEDPITGIAIGASKI